MAVDRRYLTIRILYPKPGRAEDILAAVVGIGAWLDKENDRIVNISLWESEEQAMKATTAMHGQFKDIPWSEWERRPAENFLGLSRVV